MNSLTFAGWAGDDVLRVLKTHVPVALQGIEKTDDPVKMQAYVMKMKEQIRNSKFKSLNIKLVGNMYILYIGKSIEHSTSTVSVTEIPNKLIEDCINYISHIKEGKIGRTKYPLIHNILYSSSSNVNTPVNTPVNISTKSSATINSNDARDSDEDSLDKTEVVNNIIRKKTTKVDPIPDTPNVSTPGKSRESRESRESNESHESSTKKVIDDDIEYSNIEIPEKNVKFEDEVVEEPVKPSKSEKVVEKVEKSEKTEKMEKQSETVSRKQRRRELVDDAEESRWEGLN